MVCNQKTFLYLINRSRDDPATSFFIATLRHCVWCQERLFFANVPSAMIAVRLLATPTYTLTCSQSKHEREETGHHQSFARCSHNPLPDLGTSYDPFATVRQPNRFHQTVHPHKSAPNTRTSNTRPFVRSLNLPKVSHPEVDRGRDRLSVSL